MKRRTLIVLVFSMTFILSLFAAEKGKPKIESFTIQRNTIYIFFEQYSKAGYHSLQWTAKNLASGTYIYKLSTPSNMAVNKCTLIK
ncbi:MAG: hypothetical protein WCT23_09085 [Candidatus Neomarinimicrobiota bacterium]